MQSATAMASQAAANSTPRCPYWDGMACRGCPECQTRPCTVCFEHVPLEQPGYLCVACPMENMCADCYYDRRCCERTPSLLVSEGFGNIDIQKLHAVLVLVGLDGGIVLDTQVIAHACPTVAAPPYRHEFFVTIGVNGTAVTLTDVTNALRSIPRDAFQRGRNYYWEGVTLHPSRRLARIEWGS